MENASKALLMAGGMLLVMLVIALVIYAWSTFSDYYSSQDDLAEIEDLAEFNLQFTNYQRDDVMGYDIISLVNKVTDYNARYSSVGQNDQGYEPITIIINLQSSYMDNIIYGDNAKLFTRSTYTESETLKEWSTLMNTITSLENDYGKENLQNLSKAIDSVFETEGYTNAEYRVTKFNSITSKKYADSTKTPYTLYSKIEGATSDGSYDYGDADDDIQNNFKDVAYKYYEYTQFKKGIFKCDSLKYDDDTGRVSEMSFTFTGEVE